ncbi:hypothetical protein NXV86_12830 [Bacteroides sp. BFG-257]|uniref:hypothetical protein n=1 Tax=Bacteroides TaxID=816 RepID=UPI001CC91AAA|nr:MULTISPECIES: hypothetical protein [Bacteroides]UBD72128.1 hypothetical protein K6V21_12255 [Bacteroides cellulosilyticus]UVP00729.1 hypothetical protein NXV86_12830 [Bacteroides sp. BFG-257]
MTLYVLSCRRLPVPLSCPQSGDPAKLFPGYDVDSATSSLDTEIDSGCVTGFINLQKK